MRAIWATILVFTACNASVASQGTPAAPPTPVQIATVIAAPLRDASEYVAVLRPRQSVRVQPQVEGYVTQILVLPGDKVTPGTTLMQIDPSRQEATVRSQRALRDANQATLEYSRRESKRVQQLYAGGAATLRDADQAHSQQLQAEANVAASAAQAQLAAIQLTYFRVTAPTAGTVGDITLKLGDLVSPQTLITTLDDNDVLETYLDIPLERANALKVGATLEIVDNAGRILAPSVVTFISPRADPATQTVLTKAMIDNHDGRLRSAQFTRARVIWSRRAAPMVPVLAVQSRAGQQFVWAVRKASDGGLTAELRPVQVGPVQGQSYPVLKGVAVGEKIVVSGVQKLRPGAPVVALPAAGADGGAETGR